MLTKQYNENNEDLEKDTMEWEPCKPICKYYFPSREENNYHAITTDWFHAKLKGNKLKVTFERNEMTTEKPIVLTVTASDIFYTFKFKQFANR